MGNDNYLVVPVSGNDSTRVDEATIVSAGLKKMNAKNVTLLFIGSSIETLNKKDPRSLMMSKKISELKESGVKIFACPVAMGYYNVKEEEELIYFDGDKIPGGKVIADSSKNGDTILTF
jgi:hypothetical protein